MTPQAPTTPKDRPALSAFSGLGALATRLGALDEAMIELAGCGEESIAHQARELRRQLRGFEPSVTLIGQVKAGKTTLVNALTGWPDLLPADVNPWTSVVTSLHMQPQMRRQDRRSAFRFFTNDEWDNLIRQGGRVGEIAARAGAEDELEKVRAQLDEMREKSKARLGRKFQMLLGQTHNYETFDKELIQRYVCLGDDFWEEADGSPDQGRFADITKSADLWFAGPDLPLPLCLRDTPGVNDTFMIREQITINALRGSRLCVVVLSAQQALSSVDLGLIRLISNVKAREVIIFVNRIDELADPVQAVPQIRASIVETLRKFDGPQEAEILFGSGFWAHHAVADSFAELGADSAKALVSWAETHVTGALAQLSPREIIWHLSGLRALGDAISDRIDKGPGARLEESLGVALGNLRTGLAARTQQDTSANAGPRHLQITPQDLVQQFDQIEDRAHAALESGLDKVHRSFAGRTDNARRAFLGRATGSLIKHLEQFGEDEIWTYDPSGLRMLLRSAYKVFAQGAGKTGAAVLTNAANDISALYHHAFGLASDGPAIAPPPLPAVPAPIGLGQTIALDLRGSWWARFWRRQRGYEAFSEDFARLIHEETKPVVETLHQQCAAPHAQAMRQTLSDFMQGQRDVLLGLAQQAAAPPAIELPPTAPVNRLKRSAR
ncbi:GTP-binding protein Der [Antarctobacter heliothermus]|uniref:GTP-binding protein Der n=1 Tax=Antarctobacter heliothermus TaxID=74033 RepID=A0A222E4P2_9RHOB|nr:dynamin family protein [Antarctobacter heliothermus]ASP21153.1 GTP-binding protein Der [Antarctobacter heliothermus]